MMIKDMAALGRLVATQHGWPAAKAFKGYRFTERAPQIVATAARETLEVFPQLPGACALMSAAFAVHLERTLTAPIRLVAGTLRVEDKPVFGDGMPFDGASVFGTSNPDWDGHVWVMIGPYVADISLFRTAYSAKAPPELAKHVYRVFGEGRGLYVDRWDRTRKLGLAYEPFYVLSEEEVTSLMRGAYALIDGSRGSKGST